MKKTLFLIIGVITSLSGYAQFRAGAGFSYATEISNIGLEVTGVYEITEKWEGAATFTYIFEKDYLSWSILDLDGHYVFHSLDKFDFYGLAGVSFIFWKVDVPETNVMGFIVPGYSENGTEVGFNIGGGAKYNISEKFSVVPELKLTIMESTFFRFGVTAQYRF